MEDAPAQRAARLLRTAHRMVVFTGAGMSAESGVPTFRDDLTGLWARYDAAQLATPQAFQADPDLVWGWYEWRRTRVSRAVPNPGHLAVTTMAARIPDTTVVTQNVDDLHERAGTPAPIHLHGSLFTPRCTAVDGHPAPLPPDTEAPPEGSRIPPPRCATCGHPVRPGVVWFGEPLPEAEFAAAVDAAATCDLLLAVGTSGVVHPAAEIPRVAARSGATVIQVNPQPTPLDPVATVTLRGTAAQTLHGLVSAAWPH
ncbi:SIR2 family NAD-dependent protein deacylase [Micromonospora sp. SH-82]|uniref:SIR2 family NAD-dependent protein deacylase n=1 Tax=Micromonospora sp. SH-82 TaxID=3132938 RepID=UPI003EB88948